MHAPSHAPKPCQCLSPQPCQALLCLEGHTQALDFWCCKYTADGSATLPVSFADCTGCSWEPAEVPSLAWTALSAPLPSLAAAATLGAASVEPAAVLRELCLALALAGVQAVHALLQHVCRAGSPHHSMRAGSPGWLPMHGRDAPAVSVGTACEAMLASPALVRASGASLVVCCRMTPMHPVPCRCCKLLSTAHS